MAKTDAPVHPGRLFLAPLSASCGSTPLRLAPIRLRFRFRIPGRGDLRLSRRSDFRFPGGVDFGIFGRTNIGDAQFRQWTTSFLFPYYARRKSGHESGSRRIQGTSGEEGDVHCLFHFFRRPLTKRIPGDQGGMPAVEAGCAGVTTQGTGGMQAENAGQ